MRIGNRQRAALGLCITVTFMLWGHAGAGIFNTKHNLSSRSVNGTNSFNGTQEICVFCHTPHGANSTVAVPLWNRNVDPNGFETYDQLGTTTLDANIEPVGSVSIACLSCHDGTQAMDALINEPGSGTRVSGFNLGKWSGKAQNTDGRIARPAVVTNLGKDLTNDHPIGIQYAGGGYAISNAGGPGKDPDFNQARSEIVGTSRTWWVNTATGSNAFERTDLKLYTRVATGGAYPGEPQPYVECASCHDPHVDKYPTFLRIDPRGSAVCLTCHSK